MAEAAPVTVAQAVEALGLGVAAGGERLETPIAGAQVCDLLSYVMAQGRAGQMWITVQTHPNIVAVAALHGLSGVLIAGGFAPDEETLARAEEEDLPLLTSAEAAYTLAGKLYAIGVR
jgi:predicted transcriptional regulator